MDVTLGVRLADGRGRVWSRASTTTPGSACAPRWWPGPRPGRCARRCSRPWGATASPRRSCRTTARSSQGASGPGTGLVRFDRICQEHGIRHLLTAPGSPTTTGKVERFHKTLKREFLDGKVFDSIEEAQAAIDAWVHDYNHTREHQSLGNRPPVARFALARRRARRARRRRTGVGYPCRRDPTASAGASKREDRRVAVQVPRGQASGRARPWRCSLETACSRSSTMACSSPPTPGDIWPMRRCGYTDRQSVPQTSASRGCGGEKGKRTGFGELRRHPVQGGQRLSPVLRRAHHHTRHRPDLPRRKTPAHPRQTARPRKGARCPRKPWW